VAEKRVEKIEKRPEEVRSTRLEVRSIKKKQDSRIEEERKKY